MKGNFVIKDLKKFVGPLKAISNSINSVVFTRMDDTFRINAATADGSQIANIKFSSKVVELTEPGDIEKIGIFDLSQFLTALGAIGDNNVEIKVEGNILNIKYSDKASLSYMLSDLSLIKEGPGDPKKQPEFIATVEINTAFIKKVKSISGSIGGNILRFIGKKGKFLYTVGDRNSQSHNYKEVLLEEGINEDFEILLSIKDDKRSNFDFLYDGCNYELSIHPRLIQLKGITEDFGLIRFFLAPLKTDE